MTGKKKPATTNSGNGAADLTGARKESYDPSYFRVPGQDHNGHHVRIFCNIQPAMAYEIDAILQSHNWPFRVKGDFFRWAVWEGIKRLEKMRPVPGSMIVVADTINTTCKSTEIWLAFKNSVETTETTVKSLLESGNETEALKLLSKLRSQVMQLDEASWREQWLDAFNKRFGHIWSRAKEKAVGLNEASKG